MPDEFEVYQTVFRVTEWLGNEVYKTERVNTDWFPMSVVDNNNSRETNLIYTPADHGSTLEELRGIRTIKGDM